MSTPSPTQQNDTLLLSGGGFRATLFHLGVIRFLAEQNHLSSISKVYSVSGGSVLAGYLALNWSEFSNPEAFANVADKVVAYAQSDVRGRMLRRLYFYAVLGLTLLLLPLSLYLFLAAPPGRALVISASVVLAVMLIGQGRFKLVGMFQSDLALFLKKLNATKRERGNAKLRDLRVAAGPTFHILATDLTAGSPWIFTHNGMWHRDDEWKRINHELLPLGKAVAASAAFPPMFSPVRIARNLASDQLSTDHFLTDGGVFDNLGVYSAVASFDGAEGMAAVGPGGRLIASNAERLFENNHAGTFRSLVKRAVRSTDILMARVSELQLPRADVRLPLAFDDDEIQQKVPVATQRLIRNIRTDLDEFSTMEIQLLYFKGYLTAWKQLSTEPLPLDDFELSTEGVPLNVRNNRRWLPFRETELEMANNVEDALEHSDKTRMTWFTRKDKTGTCLVVLATLALLLLNPVTLRGFRYLLDKYPAAISGLEGEWYHGTQALPEAYNDLDVFLRQPPAGGGLYGFGTFLTKPFSQMYKWRSHGSFKFRIEVASPYRLIMHRVGVINPDKSVKILRTQSKDRKTLEYHVPPKAFDQELVVVLAVAPATQPIEEEEIDIKLPKVNEVVRFPVVSE